MGSGVLYLDDSSQYPISPPPMKSVTNSKRSPFQVKRNGHEEGFRSSSSTRNGEGSADSRVSDCRMPDGQKTRTASAPGRLPRPNTMSAGATAGAPAERSS